MALGAGYPETGSKNESAIHWDLICDLREGGEILVDEELLYKNGKFVIAL
jgi:aminopeptidase